METEYFMFAIFAIFMAYGLSIALKFFLGLALLPFCKRADIERKLKSAYLPLLALSFIFMLVFGIKLILPPSDVSQEYQPGWSTGIISSFRNFHSGAMMYFSETRNSPDVYPEGHNYFEQVRPYMNIAELARWPDEIWALRISSDILWVGCSIRGYYRQKEGVDYRKEKGKLLERARAVQLYGTSSLNVVPVSTDIACLYTDSDDVVWMPRPVRRLR